VSEFRRVEARHQHRRASRAASRRQAAQRAAAAARAAGLVEVADAIAAEAVTKQASQKAQAR
jgi:hypothetical protein